MGKNLPRVSYRLMFSLMVGLLTFFSAGNSAGLVANPSPKSFVFAFSEPPASPTPEKPTSSCPSDLKTLTDLLLKDIPSYANRVMQRARQINKEMSYSYVLIAGRPEFEPLPISPTSSQYPPVFSDSTEQIFFTTLERQYSRDRAVQMQLYHWLFLTPTEQGWKLNTVFTRIGSSVPGRPPLPPKETSSGIIGQAVTLWLRDCQAGAINR